MNKCVCASVKKEEEEIKTRNKERKISWGDIIPLFFPLSVSVCISQECECD